MPEQDLLEIMKSLKERRDQQLDPEASPAPTDLAPARPVEQRPPVEAPESVSQLLTQIAQHRRSPVERSDRPFPHPVSVGGLFRAVRTPQQRVVYGPLVSLARARRGGEQLTPENLLRASKEASTKDLSGSDVLNEFGFTGTSATVGGLALDLIADPLWFIAPAKVARLLRMPEALKLIKGTTAVQKTASLIKELPSYQKLARAKRFVFGGGLGKRYERHYDDHNRENAEGGQQALGSRSLAQQLRRETPEVQRYVSDFMEAGSIPDPVKGQGYFLKGDSSAQQKVLDRATSELGQATSDQIANLGGKSVQMFTDLGMKMVKAGLMTWDEWVEHGGQHYRHAYRIHEEGFPEFLASIPEKLKQHGIKNIQRKAGMEEGPLTAARIDYRALQERKDLSDELREVLGLIREASYPVAKGEFVTRKALATVKFQNRVNKAFGQDFAQTGFTRVPNSKQAYGALANRFLPDAIVEDLARTAKYDGLRKGLWKQGVSWWKFGKVVANPAAWSRNIMSNFILADKAGVAPFKIHRDAQGIESLRKKDRYYREAQKAGTFLTDTHMASEMNQILADTPDVLMEGLKKSAQKVGTQGTIPATSAARAGTKKLSDFYQWQEQVFKMSFYIDKRKAGVGAREAARLAEQALFNYRKVPQFVDILRTTGIAPFITFPFKAIPATGRGLAKRPAVFNRYGHIFRSFEDRKSADLRSNLPDYMRDSWMQVGEEKDGNVTYLNLGYILPFSDVASAVGGDPTHQRNRDRNWLVRTSQDWLQKSPPAQIAATVIFGQDAFTGKELKTNADWFDWAANTIMPPVLPGGYTFREFTAAAKGLPVQPLSKRAKARTLTETALAGLAGLRTKTLNMSEEQRWRVWEFGQDGKEIRDEMQALVEAYHKGNIEPGDFQEQFREVSERLRVFLNPDVYGPED